MGAAASIPLVAVAATATFPLPAAAFFSAGVAVGLAAAAMPASATMPAAAAMPDSVNDALNSVNDAAEAVIDYIRILSSAYEKAKKAEAFVQVLKDGVVKPVCDKASSAVDGVRNAASSAWHKLKAAAAFVRDKVMKLVGRLFGRKEAAAAERELDRAAAAQEAGLDDVLSRASARAAGCQRLLDARALPPPSAVVSATPPGGALALQGSVAALAKRASRRASEMMARLKDVFRGLRGTITKAASSCISVIVAAVGICLEAINGPTAAAAAAADV